MRYSIQLSDHWEENHFNKKCRRIPEGCGGEGGAGLGCLPTLWNRCAGAHTAPLRSCLRNLAQFDSLCLMAVTMVQICKCSQEDKSGRRRKVTMWLNFIKARLDSSQYWLAIVWGSHALWRLLQVLQNFNFCFVFQLCEGMWLLYASVIKMGQNIYHCNKIS